VRNGGDWKGMYREGWVKNGREGINAVKKRGKTRFFDLTTVKNAWQTTGHGTDAFRNLQSGKYLCFPKYIFRINAIMVNEGNVCTSL
jgi:hypothetical protein